MLVYRYVFPVSGCGNGNAQRQAFFLHECRHFLHQRVLFEREALQGVFQGFSRDVTFVFKQHVVMLHQVAAVSGYTPVHLFGFRHVSRGCALFGVPFFRAEFQPGTESRALAVHRDASHYRTLARFLHLTGIKVEQHGKGAPAVLYALFFFHGIKLNSLATLSANIFMSLIIFPLFRRA